MVVQIALSFVLVVIAGLLARSFSQLAGRPLDLEPSDILITTLNGSRMQGPPEQRADRYRLVMPVARYFTWQGTNLDRIVLIEETWATQRLTESRRISPGPTVLRSSQAVWF